MADKTMPPSDPMPEPSAAAAPGDMGMPMPPPAMPEQPQDGSVMISMPKEAFDAMHQIVNELAKGLDALAQSVGQQGGASSPMALGSPASEAPNAPSAQAAGPGDEEFLKSIAQEGSIR